jgi:hypothetical protein
LTSAVSETANALLISGVFALSLELMLGGTTLGAVPVDREVMRKAYPRLWWAGPVALLAGGVVAVIADSSTPPVRAIGLIAAIASIAALVPLRPPAEPRPMPAWVVSRRRSRPITDTRRWARLALLVPSALALVMCAFSLT